MNDKELADKCLNCTVPWEKCNPPECLKGYLKFDESKKEEKPPLSLMKDSRTAEQCRDVCPKEPKCWVSGGNLDMSKCPLNCKERDEDK